MRNDCWLAAVLSVGLSLPCSAAGPAFLVRNIHTGSASSATGELRQLGGDAFFCVERGRTSELWRSDGTKTGTNSVARIPGSCQHLTVVGDTLFLVEGYHRLWRSDGSEAGTELAWASPRRTGPALDNLTDVDGTLFLTEGHRIWRSDGTADGTTLVKEKLTAGSLTGVDASLFFVADDGVHGREIWTSDGTPEGTHLVRDIQLGPGSALPSGQAALVAYRQQLFFAADDGVHGEELWVSDGTEAGTRMVAELDLDRYSSGPDGFAEFGQELFFAQGGRLWKTLGDRRTTIPLSEPGGLPLPIHDLTPAADSLFFSCGGGLCESDGTPTGTSLLVDINPEADCKHCRGGGRYPHELTAAGDRLFFTAWEARHGWELWTSDGCAAGSRLVRDVARGDLGSEPLALVALGKRVLFTALEPSSGRELWKSDGTSAGTRLVQDLTKRPEVGSEPRELVAVGERLLFTANDGTHGRELWSSRGTPLTTRLVRDINPATDPQGPEPRQLTRVGDFVLLVANDAVHGSELWRSDGTRSGTRLVRDMSRGVSSSAPRHFTVLGNQLFFSLQPYGQLWVSDGTLGGTREVMRTSILSSLNGEFGTIGRRILFPAFDERHGTEIWRSDGTAERTRLVRDLHRGQHGSFPAGFARAGDQVFFAAEDKAHGRELWATDGRSAGTSLVRDIWPGGESSLLNGFRSAAVGEMLFFSACEPTRGCELWRTDGTAAGTRLVRDIGPGSRDSISWSPHPMIA